MSARGRFITVEGIDGAGKSSHLEALARLIRARGHEVLVTRNPGGTPFGARLREVILHHPAPALAEALVMFADRSVHVQSGILPALDTGTWVLCDRFSDSTYAYQCGGRGLAREDFLLLEKLVHPDLQPDATFLFDLDPEIASRRQAARSNAPDKFEREGDGFFTRVREAYLERARQHAARFHVIDASADMAEVERAVTLAFARAFP
jgi:dTMP kinase